MKSNDLGYTTEHVERGRRQVAARGDANLALGDLTLEFVPASGSNDPDRDRFILSSFAEEIGVKYGTLLKYRRVAASYTQNRRDMVAKYKVRVPYRVIQAVITVTGSRYTEDSRWLMLEIMLSQKAAQYQTAVTEKEYVDSLDIDRKRGDQEFFQEAIQFFKLGQTADAANLLSHVEGGKELGRLVAGWKPRGTYKNTNDGPVDQAKSLEDLVLMCREAGLQLQQAIEEVVAHGQYGPDERSALMATMDAVATVYGNLVMGQQVPGQVEIGV